MEKNVEKNKVMWTSTQPSLVQKDETQLENMEYFSYVDSLVTKGATRMHEFRAARAKAALNRKKTRSSSKFDLNLRQKLENFYI